MNWNNIDIGAFLDDPTAETIRSGGEKLNDALTYLFPLVNQGTKVREIIRGFSTTSGTLPANAVASINAGNQFTIPANQLGVVTFLQSNNPPSPLPPTSDLGYTKFSFIIETGAGTYGSGATTLVEQNLIQLAPVNVGIEPSLLFELGNIGTATIETYVNGSGAYFINGLAVFTATQVVDGDSLDKQWLFVGGDGNWGDGATATTAEMFVDLATQGGDNPNPNNLPNDVISGREVVWTGTGLVFIITQGVVRFNGVEFIKSEQTVTLAASDPTNDRFDTFFDEIVNAGAITGTPAINPIQPQVDPLTQIRLTSVLIEATATTPVEVVDEPIYLENEQPPEYTGSSTGVGVVNFNSADDPFEGAKCISVLGVQNLKRVIMTRATDVDFATFETLSIALRQAAIIGQATKERLFIGLLDSSDNELIVPVPVPLEFNLDWQVIGFSMDAFNWYGATTGRKVYIEYRLVSANKAQGFFIDNWRLQGGISPPTPINKQTPPVHKWYDSEAGMIGDQLQQKKQWLYFDGTQYWEYLGTVLGTIADYREVGGDVDESKWEITGNDFNLRLPTETELNAERLTWGTNNLAGAFGSPLKLPAAGQRQGFNGSITDVGTGGLYWSSTTVGVNSIALSITGGTSLFLDVPRRQGISVRLIVDGTFTETQFEDNYENEIFTYNGLTYGFVYNPTTDKIWLDRNLGASQAATSSTDSDAYGDIYQWGRSPEGHQLRTSGTYNGGSLPLPSTATESGAWDGLFIFGSASPFDWLIPQDNNLWQGLNGFEDSFGLLKLIGKDGLKADYNDLLNKPLRPDPTDDNRPEWDNGTDWKGLAYRDEVVPSLETGTVISFANPEIYNSSGTPATGNITNDLTGALQGVVQKIYHNHSIAPTVPAGWVLMGAGTYVISELNVIYAEYAGGTRVEYWIVNEA